MILGRRAVLCVYVFSGAAGLVYEVAWTRLLTLELGHTVAAASTVLAAFMGGLAAGAWAAGRLPSFDPRASLRIYALLEIVIAAAALLLPLTLSAAIPALQWAYADGNAPARLAFVRTFISVVLVGIPSAAMGATFPLVAGAAAASTAEAGALYAANTIGAAAGAIAAGFWLVPAFGLRATTWVGVALNGIAAAGAWTIAARPLVARERGKQPQDGRTKTVRTARQSAAVVEHNPPLAAAAAAVSGAAALVYEVGWTRLIALVIGPTTYAFATMAAAFITGIAVGSSIGSRLARRTNRPASWLGATLAIGAAAATLSAWYVATEMPINVAVQVADPAAEFSGIVWRQAFVIGLLLLPTTVSLGAAFPLALAFAGGRERSATVARETARVYAANTLGAIAGSLVAGFVLIPSLGLRSTIRDTAFVAALAGAAIIARSRNATPRVTVAAAVAAAVMILLVPGWDRALLASGAYKYAPYIGGADLDAVLRAGTLVYYREGSAGTVSVRDLNGTRSLAIDGKVDASNAGDMLTQRLLGLLPVLVHGRAEDLAVIGLGSGVTVASALAPGTVRRADVVEISPEVVAASRFFDTENARVLDKPGVRLIVGDGRSHLLLTSHRYDVIVSEPSNPWMAGVATLFTREFFEAAKSRLRPNGLLCQWAHTYDIQSDDLRSIVATFAQVFPQGTMWLVGGGDLLLIGAADGDLASRLAAVGNSARSGAVDAVLRDVGAAPGTAPFALLSMYAGGPRELASFAANSVIQTDDHLPLEYSAPRGIYGRTKVDNAATLRDIAAEKPPAVRHAFDRATAEDWASRGSMDLKAQAFDTAYNAFREAVTRNGRHIGALAGLSDAAGGVNRLGDERQFLEAIATREPDNAAVRIELSRVRAVLGDGPAAAEAASDALRLAPDDPRAGEQLASVFADLSQRERLMPLADAMIARFPDRADPVYYRATALYLGGQTDAAIALARRVVDRHPDHARAQGLLAAACAAAGQRDCAQAAFEASIRANPRDPAGYVNAGAFQLQVANPSVAANYFASALAIDPNSESARNGLAQARAQLASR